ncbi:hypothetical protein D9M72_63720 [compost metagenome]
MGSHYAVKAWGFDGQSLTVRFTTKKYTRPADFCSDNRGVAVPSEGGGSFRKRNSNRKQSCDIGRETYVFTAKSAKLWQSARPR